MPAPDPSRSQAASLSDRADLGGFQDFAGALEPRPGEVEAGSAGDLLAPSKGEPRTPISLIRAEPEDGIIHKYSVTHLVFTALCDSRPDRPSLPAWTLWSNQDNRSFTVSSPELHGGGGRGDCPFHLRALADPPWCQLSPGPLWADNFIQVLGRGGAGLPLSHRQGRLWGVPLVITVIAVALKKIGYDASDVSVGWCWIDLEAEDRVLWMLLTGKLWELLAYVTLPVLYLLIRKHIGRAHAALSEYRPIISQAQQLQRQTSVADKKLVLIPLIFIFLRVWSTVRFILTLYSSPVVQSPVLVVLHVGLPSPSPGAAQLIQPELHPAFPSPTGSLDQRRPGDVHLQVQARPELNHTARVHLQVQARPELNHIARVTADQPQGVEGKGIGNTFQGGANCITFALCTRAVRTRLLSLCCCCCPSQPPAQSPPKAPAPSQTGQAQRPTRTPGELPCT
ncbi:G protein-coupled receptor 157-like protein [Camelus ferus]|nr:G protein-coupled receptor 157-like protein [Camelus ferus]